MRTNARWSATVAAVAALFGYRPRSLEQLYMDRVRQVLQEQVGPQLLANVRCRDLGTLQADIEFVDAFLLILHVHTDCGHYQFPFSL